MGDAAAVRRLSDNHAGTSLPSTERSHDGEKPVT